MNRYRVLIVDDEMMIRQGLTKLIVKHAEHWEVAGEARNGLEAMEMFKRLKPHLVITDIRMPYMEGIELARQIYEADADIAVVILTGYKDFEYAQAALRYGVLDFLLKPCPEEEVVRVLNHAYRKITEEIVDKEKRLAEERRSDQHAVRAIMLRLSYDQSRLESIKNSYMDKELWLMKVATYFPKNKSYGYNDMGLLQFAIANIAEELIETFKLQAILLQVSYDIFAVFASDRETGSACMEELRATIDRLLGIGVQVRHAGQVIEPGRLPDCMDLLSEPGDAAVMESATDHRTMRSSKIRSIQNEMMSTIMLGQPEQVKERMEARLAAVRSLPVEEAKGEAATIAAALYEIVKKDFSSGHRGARIGERIDRLHRSNAIGDVLNWIEEQKDWFLAEFHSWMDGHNQNIIEKSIRYMEERYMDRCDLKEVADYVHLSANYFSNLFKKETGESFVNYMTKIRIDKAKVLIGNTELKVFEIAEKVGYEDPNYFTTVFRQATGMSPSQYRKSVKEEATK